MLARPEVHYNNFFANIFQMIQKPSIQSLNLFVCKTSVSFFFSILEKQKSFWVSENVAFAWSILKINMMFWKENDLQFLATGSGAIFPDHFFQNETREYEYFIWLNNQGGFWCWEFLFWKTKLLIYGEIWKRRNLSF